MSSTMCSMTRSMTRSMRGRPSLAFAHPLVLAALLVVAVARPSGAGAAADPAAGASAHAPLPPSEERPIPPYDRWKWIEDTYWIVPSNGIFSIYHPLGTDDFVVTRGQTVFHITDYFNGYFTGSVVVKLTTQLVPSCQYMLGQVTPEGRVYMTMYDVASGAVTNTPLGTMVKKGGKWTMVNQMTGPASGGTLSHWAYMVQSKREDPTFRDLPWAHESVPQFLSACPPGPKIRER